jgi:MoaA/NifB/PqqE/SkfB family radical SAM enzyme
MYSKVYHYTYLPWSWFCGYSREPGEEPPMANPLGKVRDAGVRKGIRYVSNLFAKDFDRNYPRVFGLMEKLFPHPVARATAQKFQALAEVNHPIYQLLRRSSVELSPQCRESFINNLILNSMFVHKARREQFMEEHGFYPPLFIVISPTMRCNLTCEGCWAGKYSHVPDMELSLLQKILNECRDDMGMHYYVISGGEPFVRKDLFDIYREYPDCFFMIYTNGTLINEKLADEIAGAGNVAPMISVEGGEKETDSRRSPGVYEKTMRTMDLLKERGVLFGFSVTATRHNVDAISSDEFIDFMLSKGVFWGWYFQYIPIGRDPDTSLMITPEQREILRKRVYRQRSTKPILLADFWNDGPTSQGCMAGGKKYLHINCNGDAEPCVFAHFAVDNVKDKSLLEILKSPFFTEIRRNIPYDGNELRACMLVDRPWIFREYCKKFQPKATHEGAESLITDLADDMDRNARGVAEIFDPAWAAGDWQLVLPDLRKDAEVREVAN